MRNFEVLLCLALMLFQSLCSAADDIPTDPLLGERIEFVRSNRLFPVSLETTVFQPQSANNAPLLIVIINHGKALGLNALQGRSRPIVATRLFLSMGYAVVAPMRQGFSRSGGSVVGEGCDIDGNGMAQADDIDATVKWLKTQAWADTSRMVIMGQSHGGLATLAYATQADAGAKVFVNFAGGLKWISGGCQWERNLLKAYESYGAKTKAQSLWFYGANDSYFPPYVIQPAFDAYMAAGGKAKMIAFPAFGNDAHGMFGSVSGLDIWQGEVLSAMAAQGLPTTVMYPQFANRQSLVRPVLAGSGFAVLSDSSVLPAIKDTGRRGYETFLTKPVPRAFALGPKGEWSWANGSTEENTDPNIRALNGCAKFAKQDCKLYAVDNEVVWVK